MTVFNSASDLKERGFQLRSKPISILSLDPSGDGDDRDALVLLSREEHQRGEPYDPDFAVEFMFRVLMAYRLPQEWEFPDKLASLLGMHRTMETWRKAGRHQQHIFTIEVNGVGYGYASSLERKIDAKVVSYTRVASADSTRSVGRVSVPRLKGLDHSRILMETGHLRLSKAAPGIEDLKEELHAFVWRGKGRPEAMQGRTDDLVMAMSGGVWIGSNVLPPVLKQVKVDPGRTRQTRGVRMRVN